jgi:hypothetical protein
MKTLIAFLIVSSLALVVAGAIAALFGQKSGVVSLLLWPFLISYSRRIGAEKKWSK